MPPKTRKWLEDVQAAAGLIASFVAGHTLEEYRRSALLRSAVERQLEVIGEAVNRIARHDPGTAARISHHRRIVDFRNQLSHGYDLIDHGLVWRVVQDNVPQLMSEVTALLAALPEENH
ncbi:DUF86 domain-containing protein [Deinococcus koreensis]|uniref:DUF86 domain-containing protein n=1 Tax=Deinococcus koreensis TaxID=2054903 RepID=A0A2K3V142_9DEIO|nr:HepT-like ribonuclease domain-containing protein [Deinococcus koreensis]PNY82505.1 hypothetical protein CVO96_15135 [Deinococcus koreensis]